METHFSSLVGAGVDDIGAALAFRAAERPADPACLLLERGENAGEPVCYAALLESARRVAGLLCERTAPGARVLLAFPAGADFLAALFGCFYSGCIAVPAPPPRGPRGLARLAAIAQDCDAALLTTAAIRAAHAAPLPTLAIEDAADADLAPARACDPAALALLQYTSGSTGAPKGVAIPHRAIWHNQRVIRTCFDHAEGVTLVGWLPNFHDMGLIGNLLQPLYAGGLTVMMEPAAFVQKPLRWLQAISRYRAHTSGAPNFAYDLCVRAIGEEDAPQLDLSGWRVAFNGAEPIRAATLDAFARRFAPCGFRREAMMACYGLAESTLMVTGAPVDAPPHVLLASKAQLAEGAVAPASPGETATALVSCGDAVAGADVRIADAGGAALPEGAVGEIQTRSASVCAGYWGREDAPLADGGWLRTGDLGAEVDGRLYIVGRLKDVIIVHGRNVHPADVEAAVEAAACPLGAVKAGCVGVTGPAGEQALLLIEVSRAALKGADAPALVTAARAAAAAAADMPIAGVVLLKPGALPLTSSGKLRRHMARDRYLSGALSGVAHADAGAARLQREALGVSLAGGRDMR